MALTQSRTVEQNQRIDVELDSDRSQKQVKIRIESFAASLGWYTAGSLTLALHQLPLLQQAIEEMQKGESSAGEDKIIAFPGVVLA